MAQKATTAEYYRHHRQVMELALEMHCTPREAAAELARREARQRWQQVEDRLLSRFRPAEPAISDDRWMMRD